MRLTSMFFVGGLLLLAATALPSHAATNQPSSEALPSTPASASSLASLGHTNLIELDNQIISPVTQQYILDAIDRSESDGAVCLVIKLDTPGGLLESTRAIVKRMMNAKVPIVVYVAPSGSRAGSAGVFITLAAHVAAMAPSTNIGAAHPVLAGGGGGPMKKLILRRACERRLEPPQPRAAQQSPSRAHAQVFEVVAHDSIPATSRSCGS